MWPATADELIDLQMELARARHPLWAPSGDERIGGCIVCFERGGSGPGAAGDPAWAAAATLRRGRVVDTAVVCRRAHAPYTPGLLALREGPALQAAVRALGEPPDVLLVNATGRDHPRRAGLALHLGAVLGLPTIGVTNRLLLAQGSEPGEERGDSSLLRIDGEVVGAWVRTRPGAHPVAVHAGWGTGLADAVTLVVAVARRARTPEPLRRARTLARRARAGATANP
jgi:deoxyribonuclease V